MKKIVLLLFISLLLLFLGAAFSASHSMRIANLNQHTRGGLTIQITATPEPEQEEDQSIVGSTDGLVAMSVVITAIVIIPIVLKRRNWSDA
jgi:hypothetical protein